MKTFTDLFIRRPVLALVVSLVIIIAGVQALSTLNVRQYPRSDIASVTVTTAYVGASAELVRGFITTPLERAIAAADGIDYLSSQSSQSVSTITARLKLNYDSNKALSEISSKVNQVRGDLPPEAEIPVINIESSDSQFASAYLSFTSDLLQANEITDYLNRIVQPRLTALGGVQRAEILGGRTFAMRIWLKPDRMAALNVSPAQVRKALGNNNYLAALGRTKGAFVQVDLTANTDLHTVDDFKNLVVREENGSLVRLGDIADIVLGAEDYNSEVRFSGQRAVFMGIFVLPNANSIDVVKRVRVEMEAITKELPTGMSGRIAYDGTAYINTAIKDVYKTLGETLAIVCLVIFLFLGSWRSAIIPVIAIPISLIGAVFLMQMFGFTINLLTLLAIVLSVGLVVDDAIVVVENVERHLRDGLSALDAALLGARELVGPIIAMTITLAAVYVPVGIQGGLTGTLFREFAFTLAGAVTISGIVALTLSPVMSAKFLQPGANERGFAKRVNHIFDRVRDWYGRKLDATLRLRPAVYTAWIGLSIIAAIMFVLMPRFAAKELAPTEDQGVIFGIVQAPSNATIEQTATFADAANKVFMGFPETEFTFQITSPSGGFGGMVLKPWDQRERTAFQLRPLVQAKLGSIPGIELFPIMPPALPGGGNFGVEFVILSTEEPERMIELAKKLEDKAKAAGFFFTTVDTKIDQPQAQVVIDHDKVAALGLNLQQIGADISAMFGGNFVNRFNISGRAYKVIPQVERADRLNPDQLKDIYVTGPNDKLIPLGTVATIEKKTVPRSLSRFKQLNAVTISGASPLPLDQALKLFEDEAARILPKGYSIDYKGESRQLRVEGDKFLPAFGLAVVLIFLVLAAQFNSFRDPLIILLGSVPLALFGAMIFIFLKLPNPNMKFFTDSWTTSFNIYSQVGLVTLVGLIAKNAILIVEFANHLQQEGRNKIAAISEAARIRLRPVLMTTIATVAGHMPLVFVTGAGAKARNSIGLVLVGGMTIGTLFTLFIVPSLYVLIAHNVNQHRETGSDALAVATDDEAAPEPEPQFEEPALARKRVTGADPDGTWQPA
ncbi:MAG: efflux RND transporter permease subunit [Chthoniobacterales bacterium]